MVREDLSLVRRAYSAFARRDLAAVLDTLHPEIVWRVAEGLPGIGGVHRGHDAVADLLCALPADPERYRVEPDELTGSGNRVLVLGRHLASDGNGGGEMAIPFVHIWTLRDGAAVAFDGYSDSVRLGAALRSR